MVVSIGAQNFAKLRENNYFFVDKTSFIKEWWESGDDTTLITRPRRFGKTLNMSMLECFFSNKYENRGDLFEGLSIWEEEKYRQMQGTYPVIFLTFASVKTGKIEEIKGEIKRLITDVYSRYRDIMESDQFGENDRAYYGSVKDTMSDEKAYSAINRLCGYLERYYHKKVIVLLDEYDTPMQESWLAGTWDEAVSFFRCFFNATFKTNPSMLRGVITGITRISKESIFSDLNHLRVVTTTSDRYATCFGFTEQEVFDSLDLMGLGDKKEDVKRWYDGFIFGSQSDIYNPWSITSFIDNDGKFGAYWADTSGNGLINSLMQKGSAQMKQTLEDLISGKSFETRIDEQIVFNQLDGDEDAVWSLFVATGYLKIVKLEGIWDGDDNVRYTLALTNLEVRIMMKNMIKGWFKTRDNAYNDFIKALLLDDVDSMNEFMNDIALNSFSNFDIAESASNRDAPERFYHGFVLGLMVGLEGRFTITSNRESGFGRYDIMLEPTDKAKDNAYIIEFKVHKPKKEKSIKETAANALAQIEEKKYAAALTADGIDEENIRKYAFAFEGKNCLIVAG